MLSVAFSISNPVFAFMILYLENYGRLEQRMQIVRRSRSPPFLHTLVGLGDIPCPEYLPVGLQNISSAQDSPNCIDDYLKSELLLQLADILTLSQLLAH
jgi:hypothetical protein